MKRVFIFPVLILMLTACTSTSPASSPTNGSDQTAPAATSLSPLGETGAPTGGFAQGSRTPTAFTNPFTPEQTAALTDGGYVIGTDGTVKDRLGRVVLSAEGTNWVTADGQEFPQTELQIVATSGVDFNGKDIGAMLVTENDQEKLMFLPTTGEWVTPIDVAAAMEVVEFKDLPEITWNDFKSGRLFYSEQLAIKDWPENVYKPKWQYMRLSVITNVWVLSEYFDLDHEDHFFRYGKSEDRPILFENDAVQNLDAFKMRDPKTGNWTVVKGQQYAYGDNTAVLHMFFGDVLADPNDKDGYYNAYVKRSLSNPPYWITEPIISTRPDEWCGDGGLGVSYPQPSICALQGYGGLPLVRSLLPPALRQLMVKFDVEGQLTSTATETYPVGNEIFRLQQIALAQSSLATHGDFYLYQEDDPYFK